MIMNNKFSFRRLWLLARKHYSENRRPYLVGLACYAIVIFICFWCWLGGEYEDNFLLEMAFLWSSILIPITVSKISFGDSMKRGSRQIYYTLPATQGEKFLFALLNTLIMSAAAIVVCEVSASLLHTAIPERPGIFYDGQTPVGHWFANVGQLVSLSALILGGAVLACSSSKDNSAKAMAFVMIALILGILAPQLFLPVNGDYTIGTTSFIIGGNTLYCDYTVAGGLKVEFLTSPVLPFYGWYNAIVPALLVVIGWFKFREREIS